MRGRYPGDRQRGLTQIAAAVVGSAAAAQVGSAHEKYLADAAKLGVTREQAEAELRMARERPGDSYEVAWQGLMAGSRGGIAPIDESRLKRTCEACSHSMVASGFGPHDPTPEHRSRRIWLCNHCMAWEWR